MKVNCKTLKLSLFISSVSLILIIIFSILLFHVNCKIIEILLNIFIGLFGSGCVALLLSIASYNVSKRQLLEKYWQETKGLIMKISDITYLFNKYNEESVVCYVNELKNRKWREEFNSISSEKLELEDEKYKQLLIEEFIDDKKDFKNFDSNNSFCQYASKCVEIDIEKMRNDAKEIYSQYIELSKDSTIELSFMLGDIEFFSGNKAYDRIYNNLYKPLYDILNIIQRESYHFQLFLNGEGNEAIALEKLFDIQNKIFEVKIKENDECKIYTINNTIFNKLLVSLETLRADIYNVKPENVELHPIECRTYNKKIGV